MKYEDAVKRLSEIMEMLESGDTPLDKTFEYFEEGKKLIEFCRKQISDAEGRLLKLSDNGSAEEIEG